MKSAHHLNPRAKQTSGPTAQVGDGSTTREDALCFSPCRNALISVEHRLRVLMSRAAHSIVQITDTLAATSLPSRTEASQAKADLDELLQGVDPKLLEPSEQVGFGCVWMQA